MRMQRLRVFAFLAACAVAPMAQALTSTAGELSIERITGGLTEPWAFGFLPEAEGVLITERGGRLLWLREGKLQALGGLPQTVQGGQGGLLDLLIPQDFSRSREIYLLYAAPAAEGSAITLGRGRLEAGETALHDFVSLWSGDGAAASRHFGARMVESPQGHLLIGLGDRGTGPAGQEAQDLRLSHGKVMALSRSGRPLALAPGLPAGIVSYGHRNIQGAALDAEGTLWVSEHGARGGDEINRIRPGGNYGWPVISYGRNYNGAKIGTGTEAPGMEQPRLYWDPSIAPSGLVVLKGDGFAGWKGSLLAGSLKDDHIVRLDPAAGFAQEVLRAPETVRVRDLREAPDGSLWFLSVGHGALYRLTPQAAGG